MRLSAWLGALSRQSTATHHVDTAFVMGDVPPETQAQYERIAALVRQGRLILVAGSGVVLVALVIATGRGEASLRSWLVLPGALILALLFRVVDRRLADRPPGSREIPVDLAERLLALQELGDDVVDYSADVLLPGDHDRVAAAARERVAAAIATAVLILEAERAGDAEASARLRAELERTALELEAVHNGLVPGADDTKGTGSDDTG